MFHGAQLAIDAMLVSTLRANGEPHRRCPDEDGAALTFARRRKERTLPGLAGKSWLLRWGSLLSCAAARAFGVSTATWAPMMTRLVGRRRAAHASVPWSCNWDPQQLLSSQSSKFFKKIFLFSSNGTSGTWFVTSAGQWFPNLWWSLGMIGQHLQSLVPTPHPPALGVQTTAPQLCPLLMTLQIISIYG